MTNTYGVPITFSYAVTLSYLGFIDGIDFAGTSPGSLPSPVDDSADHSGYDLLNWYSATTKPLWATIVANNEDACVAAYQVNFPVEYEELVLEHDKQNQSPNLDTLTAMSSVTNLQTIGNLTMQSFVFSLLGSSSLSSMKSSMSLTSSDIGNFSTSVNSIITGLSGTASGLAPLNSSSKIPTTYLSGLNVSTFNNDSGYLTSSSLSSYLISSTAASTYVPLTRSVAGHALTADITLAKGDVGLGNVDNTSDANKLISNATQTALNAKQATITTGSTSQYIRGDLSLATFPTSLAPTGTAGGDLTGNYPSPTLATSGVSAATYTNPSITVDAKGRITAASSGALTFNNPARSLNTAFQISTTQNAIVTYSVDVTCSMTLTSGQNGTVILEYADDAAFTMNVKTVCKPTNANSGTLTIGLALSQINGVVLHGVVPLNKWARIRTVNNTGTPAFALQNAQEVLL